MTLYITHSQRTRHIEPMLVQSWASVVDGGPTLTQHCFNNPANTRQQLFQFWKCSFSLVKNSFHQLYLLVMFILLTSRVCRKNNAIAIHYRSIDLYLLGPARLVYSDMRIYQMLYFLLVNFNSCVAELFVSIFF